MKNLMPSLFLAHGSPMNAIETNAHTDMLSSLAQKLPAPRAILMVSAHWTTKATKITAQAKLKTIHDFGGFPHELYQIEYPALGDPLLAEAICTKNLEIQPDMSWGLDHGTWTVLKFLYPEANIPVLQLSINTELSLKEHLELAKSLSYLRQEGVLIIGSGNITHNLRKISWTDSVQVPWANEFDQMIKKALENNDEATLTTPSGDIWKMAHPSLEHYIPLLYAYGVSDHKHKPEFLYEGMQMGSLSMRSVLFK